MASTLFMRRARLQAQNAMPETPPTVAPLEQARTWTRGKERRAALFDLVAQVAEGLGTREKTTLRERFEAGLRKLIPLRQVSLRDGLVGPAGARSSGEWVCLEVPGRDGPAGVLEASIDPAKSLHDWDWQLLDSTRHLAALVLELERGHPYGVWPTPRAPGDGAAPLIGGSLAMQRLRQRIERVAPTDFTVLIEGESGSGKELVARQIHEISRRRRGPFVAVNCAALVESLLEAELFGIEERTATGVRGRRGKFEYAEHGTLFLDEVSDLSMSAQAKLLRAIQDLSVERVGGQMPRRIDTRIIAATNRSLAEMVEQRRFRLDLYYRLNGVEIHVPPLRSRREDIVELTNYFLERFRTYRKLVISPPALDALLAYHWPGNVRELERVMERAIALAQSEQVELDDLPPGLVGAYTDVLYPSPAIDGTMRAWGSRYARLVLQRCENNKRRACAVLGISYHTLQAYLRHRPERPSGWRSTPAAPGGARDTKRGLCAGTVAQIENRPVPVRSDPVG